MAGLIAVSLLMCLLAAAGPVTTRQLRSLIGRRDSRLDTIEMWFTVVYLVATLLALWTRHVKIAIPLYLAGVTLVPRVQLVVPRRAT